VILFALTLVLSAPPLVSAQGTQDSSGDGNSIAGKFSLRTFRGCLSMAGNQYELTVAGAVPRQYRLIGSNLAQLDAKTGHLVSITGTILDSSQSSSMNTDPERDTINFLSLDDLASTCSGTSKMIPVAAGQSARLVADGTRSSKEIVRNDSR
jgi:hypothetical protein